VLFFDPLTVPALIGNWNDYRMQLRIVAFRFKKKAIERRQNGMLAVLFATGQVRGFQKNFS
jgi:hypothetical protein